MDEETLPVEFLFTLTAELEPPLVVDGGPHGRRHLVAVSEARLEGPRLRGTLRPPAGDWVWMHPDRESWTLDARGTILTDDGVVILVSYRGIGRRAVDGIQVRTAPLFETGDPRYAWLNRIQAVGIGHRADGGRTLTYRVYALR